MLATIQPTEAATRKRKAHRKSRQGCSNCKLRRVKCDEARPRCHKCTDYGVNCNYGPAFDNELQLSAAGTIMFDVPPTMVAKIPSFDVTGLNMINTSLAKRYAELPFPQFQMTPTDFKTLQRFQTRTVRTLGTAESYKVYQDQMVRLASLNPFLMHLVLTLTLRHDRYVAGETKQSLQEAFHWYQGTAIFNYVLTQPIKPQERDAVWASAALLGAVVMSGVDAISPEEVWPLRPTTEADLDWLHISDGKREIARLAFPQGPDSAFHISHNDVCINMLKEPLHIESEFEALPDGFVEVFELDALGSVSNNPYYKPAALLNTLLPKVCNHNTILSFLTFIGHVPPDYKTLLKEKDPRAILLMAYWYAKLCEYKQWWVYKRALIECQAICIYIRRYHWQNLNLWKLLKYPASRCGLQGSQDPAVKHWNLPGWIFPS